MVEFGNSLDPDKEFDVLHGVLDFPVDDCLEEGEIAEDWNIGDVQCLGPIPSNILMELPMTSNEELDYASIGGAPEQRKSASFYTQSSVSVLESSGSCSRKKSLSIKSDNAIPARRSKRLRDKRKYPELSTSKQNCTHCESTKTPKWKKGPLGPGTLCNACGLQYRAGCLFPEYRPAESPTFVPSKHSNDRRNIVKTMQSAAGIKSDGAPELAKHVATSSSLIHPQIDRTPEPKQVEHMHVDTSLLESSCSYSKYGSKHVKHVGAKQCVSPPSPCKKALGPRTLCNACGQQYLAGHLVPEYRPKPSVTFVPSKHSKDRKNIEKIMQSTASIEIVGAPEQQHVEGMQLAKHVETSTHASLLESSPTYLKFRAKYSKHAPCVPPPSPCKKTSSVENDDDNSDGAPLQNASDPCPAVIKKCAHCESTKTWGWRKGPLGPGTLCNACGLQYQVGCLVPEYRPKASPMFVPGLNTNFPSRLVKMRTKSMP